MMIATCTLAALTFLLGWTLRGFAAADAHEAPRDVTQDLRSILRRRR